MLKNGRLNNACINQLVEMLGFSVGHRSGKGSCASAVKKKAQILNGF
jgi:hypothetical protein